MFLGQVRTILGAELQEIEPAPICICTSAPNWLGYYKKVYRLADNSLVKTINNDFKQPKYAKI